MIKYYYEALDSSGQTLHGNLLAESPHEAKEQLRAQQLILVALKQPSSSRWKSFSWTRYQQKDLSLVTRQLATLLAAGIPLEEALQGVSEQSDKPALSTLLNQVRSKVVEGYGLAQALEEHPRFFPELYRTTIAAGEQSGHLDAILENLADYIERQQAIRQKIQHAMIYPLIMMLVSFSIITFLLTYIVPSMIQVFSDTGQSLPLSTQMLIALSNFLQHHGLIIAGLLGLISFSGYRMIQIPKYRYKWHTYLLKIPFLSSMIRTMNNARYIHTFAMLFSSGVNVLDTMKISSQLIQNLNMRRTFQEATFLVREGQDISFALKQTRLIDPMALHLISSGEKSGALAPMMKRAASQLELSMNQWIDTSLSLLEPFMIIFMGGIVMFIVLATLLPIFSMEQLVG